MNNIILVDCDGVLLNWEYSFNLWMNDHGYEMVQNGSEIYHINERYGIQRQESKNLVRAFNESANIGFLLPFRDAIYYINMLHRKHGYMFHVITSMSNNPYAQMLRKENLIRLFGNVFDKFVFLDTGEDKDKVLAKYDGEGFYWIEDKPQNAILGSCFGLNPILMDHPYNRDEDSLFYQRAVDWKNVYDIIA
jgi:hypothetical protein